MPYIHANVSVNPSKEAELRLKEKLGAIIENIPGKSEAFLMIRVEGGCHLYFGGNQDGETAYVKVESFGTIEDECAKMLTQEIGSLMEAELGIPEDRTYITYEAITQWGFNGKNF